ncbi:MAG: PilZ domain-containing protein [Nitrospira sp.]|nr:PilZ domain-containing protein [Nitrospira sp.]
MGPIDEKLEHRSIMDLNIEEQRIEPRVAVHFRALVSGSMESEGTGIILDLSRSGCRLESPLLMLPGLSVELRIAVPGLEWALMIDGADVQWADEDRAGLAFARIRETEQQRLDDLMTRRLSGKDADSNEQIEVVPFEFQELEAVLAKDPELAIRKGLAWFALDPTEFRFRGGSLLNRAFPTCTPELATSLVELVRTGGYGEADFSLALLQSYLGSTSSDDVLKEIVSRCSHDDRIVRGVQSFIHSPGPTSVSGEFALAEAWRIKKESLTHWLTDERQVVKSFAAQHIAELDRMIAAERHRVETEREARERSRHEDESGHDHGYRPKPF